MKRITLRLPDDLHERLQRDASQENRSLNAQIITHLQTQLNCDDLQDIIDVLETELSLAKGETELHDVTPEKIKEW